VVVFESMSLPALAAHALQDLLGCHPPETVRAAAAARLEALTTEAGS